MEERVSLNAMQNWLEKIGTQIRIFGIEHKKSLHSCSKNSGEFFEPNIYIRNSKISTNSEDSSKDMRVCELNYQLKVSTVDNLVTNESLVFFINAIACV